jgi:hypothetical protein
VHYSDEISNRRLLTDLAKVVDFIEEMERTWDSIPVQKKKSKRSKK